MQSKKQVMFQVSNSLPKLEALNFARSLNHGSKYFLVKVWDNPKERHVAKREKFVVVRYPRENEKVIGAHEKIVDQDKLINV